MATRRSILTLGAVAGVALIAVGGVSAHRWWTAEDESRAESRRRLASVLTPDITAPTRIAFAGDVLIAGIVGRTEPAEPRGASDTVVYRQGCEALCAAMLAAPNVRSVTVAPIADDRVQMHDATRFRLLPRDACPKTTVTPQDLTRLRRESPAAARAGVARTIVDSRSIETAWSLRLSATDCIVADAARGRYDMAVSHARFDRFGPVVSIADWRWSRAPLPVTGETLRITRGGRLVFRRTVAGTLMMDRPRLPGIVGFMGYATPAIGWRRINLTNAASTERMDTDALILAHTTLDPAAVGDGTMARARAQLAATIADPRRPADDPAFALADTWMRSLTPRTVEPADTRLLVALIADPRVTAFDGMWDATRALGAQAVRLRNPILRRLNTPGILPSVGKPLSAQLPAIARLAPAPAADIALADAILVDPDKRMAAPGLIIEQADRGAIAVPLLLRIMRDHGRRWSEDRTPPRTDEIVPIDAARVALCRIGPNRAALAGIRRLVGEGILPPGTIDDRDWTLFQARLGAPIDDIVGQGASAKARLHDRLARFDPDRDCRRNWT